MRSSQNQNKSEKRSGRSRRQCAFFSRISKFATVIVAFLLAFIFSGLTALNSNTMAIGCTDGVTASGGICSTETADVHVSVEGGWAISVSSAGTLGVDVSPTNSGVLSMVVDNVNVYTNIPTGYQLYLNSTSGSTSIYNSSDTEQSQSHFVETSGTKAMPVELAGDTWGYSLDNSPTAFSKVPLTSDDPDSNIYTNPTKTSSSGDDIPVTYGFMADTKLSPGTYSTSVTYTAIADAPTYTITSVSPNMLLLNDQTNKTITIMTSTPATELAFGEVSAKIGDIDLTDCSEITEDGYRGVTCTYSGSLTSGTYNVSLTSTWHNATYVLENGIRIGGILESLTYMQDMTSDICKAASAKEKARLLDARGQGNGGSDKTSTYGIVKAIGDAGDEDSECWMTDNLNLYNITVAAAQSDFTSGTFNIPNGITTASQWNSNIYTKAMVEVAHGLGDKADKTGTYYGQVYYNWSAAVAVANASGYTTNGPGTSICPNHWTLPLNGSDTVARSWAHLLANVADEPITTGAELLVNSDLGFTLYYGMWYWPNLSENSQGANGVIWSSKPSAATHASYLSYTAKDVVTTGNRYKGTGMSIRCVAR